MTMTTMFRDLPQDLVEEIISYVPATYLQSLESTCKRWHRLFNGDSRFVREHTDKAAKQFLVLMLNEYKICPAIINLNGSVEFKSELSLVNSAQFDIVRVVHCDGLLLCTFKDAFKFVVWNPVTGETRWFQRSNRGVKNYEYLLGYYQEDNEKRYKILSFSSVYKDFEIYEFGFDSWRTVYDVIAPCWKLTVSSLSVSLKGNIYWFASDGTENISLLKFDFKTEKSVPVLLPYPCKFFESQGICVVREEKISVLLQPRDDTSKTEIWVTNKIDETTTQVVSWSKVLAFDLCPDLQITLDVNFLLDEEKKVVMMCVRWLDMEDETETKGKSMIYTVGEDGKVTQVELGKIEDNGCRAAILNYVPSLVQIEQAGGKRKRGNLYKM